MAIRFLNEEPRSSVKFTETEPIKEGTIRSAASKAEGISAGPTLGEDIAENFRNAVTGTIEQVKTSVNAGLFGIPERMAPELFKTETLTPGEKFATSVIAGEAISTPIINFALSKIKAAYAIPAVKDNKFIQNSVKSFKKILTKSPKKVQTAKGLEIADEKIAKGLTAIQKNKELLQYTDDAGRLPQTLEEGVAAASQTKKNVREQYVALRKLAGDDAALDMAKVADKVEDSFKGKKFEIAAPEVQEFAAKEAARLRQKGLVSLDDAEGTIEVFNQQLAPFYGKTITPEAATITGVRAKVASILRESVDDVVMSSDDVLSASAGKSYQELKNTYGSVAEIEKSLVSKLDKLSRITKLPSAGTFDTVPILYGAFTGNKPLFVSGILQKGIKGAIARQRDPNVILKNAFNTLDRSGTKTIIQKLIETPRKGAVSGALTAIPRGD